MLRMIAATSKILMFWRKPAKQPWQLPDMRRLAIPSNTKIYLIGFAYDQLTTQTATWIRDVLSSRKANQKQVLRFSDNTCTKDELRNSLLDTTPRVEIFCGHGCSDGLFGPDHAQAAGSILTDPRFVIYDFDMITPTPSSMFAFCCHAGKNFGRAFTALQDKRFMGFKDDVPLPIELYDDLKYVFQTVAKDIIIKGEIEENHHDMFLERLHQIASQSSSYQNPTLLELWLGEYQKYLMTYT